MSESISARQAQLFSQPATNVFAILDSASIPDLVAQLDQYQPEYSCLYRGELPVDLAAVAPYLVRLEQSSELMKWLLLEGFGRHWGIFAVAKANLRTMRQHFRSLLTVQLPEGETVYFRFYDPRVFRVFLPTCDIQQSQIMFGPTLYYFIEEGNVHNFLRFASPNTNSNYQTENKGLAIREEQRQVLREYMLKQFEDRMVVHLKKSFPNETKEISDSALRQMIKANIDKSAQYQVENEADVKRYLEYVVRYGTDFDANLSWVAQILGNKHLTGTDKMNQIDDYDLFVLQAGGG